MLIEAKCKDLLPDWLRFLKGCIDSEDLPLSLSREKPQDSRLLQRIRDVLTRKLLRYLLDEQRTARESYHTFYREYHMFLKEGLCSDHGYMELLSKLLLFEVNTGEAGALMSLDEYIAACTPAQQEIYYIVAPNRAAALSSPYYEAFKRCGRPVLLLYNAIDEFVMGNLRSYAGRPLVSAETSSITFDQGVEQQAPGEAPNSEGVQADKLQGAQAEELCAYLSDTLGTRVRAVKLTHRLSDSPAIVTDHESGALRRMMKMMEQANAGKGVQAHELPPQQLEINPQHPLILQLYAIKDKQRATADLVAQQLFDNALLAAGLVDDPRYMLPRLQSIMLQTLQQANGK